MNTVIVEEKYLDEILLIADKMLIKEIKQLQIDIAVDKKDIEKSLIKLLKNQSGLVCLENDKVVGFLLYYQWDDEDTNFCFSPYWGNGAIGTDRVKIMSILFQQLAEKMTENNQKVHFDIKLYAHDEEMLRLFSFLQFGIQCEDGICTTQKGLLLDSNNEKEKFCIKEYTNEDIQKQW